MSLSIHSNVDSWRVQTQLGRHTQAVGSSLAKLSSGLRINGAADDPAGLVLSERMRASIRSLGAASRNIQDGISLAQTAEGALQETANLLGRLREITVQAQSGTLSAGDRALLDRDASSIVSEIDRLARQTSWGSRTLLDGTALRIRVQAGIRAEEPIWLQLGDATAGGLHVRAVHLDTFDHARRAVAAVDAAIESVSAMRATLGAGIHRLQSAWNSTQIERENLVASESRIRDVDVAEETSNLVRSQILQESAVSVLRQANLQPVLALLLLKPEH